MGSDGVVVVGVVLVDVSDDDDSSVGVVVTVVVSGGGAASRVCGADPPSWSPKISTEASTTAAANITMVAAIRPICVGPNRFFFCGGAAAAGTGAYSL